MEVKKHYLSADQYQRDMWRLASRIRQGGWKPDFLVGLWRGGAPVAIAVHEFFKVTGWDVKHIPLKCWSYTGIGQNEGKVGFMLGDAIFGMFRPGDKILFIDDGGGRDGPHARRRGGGEDRLRLLEAREEPDAPRARLCREGHRERLDRLSA